MSLKSIIKGFRARRSVESSLGLPPYDSPEMTAIKHELLAIALKTDSDVILIDNSKRHIVETLAELNTDENTPSGYNGRIFGKFVKFVNGD
jgi:hypothetical protein